MASWVGEALRRGILSSRYPAADATEEELPVTARAPELPAAPKISAGLIDACPVGAISERTIDQGRCVRCARCLPHGAAFTGPAEAARPDRSARQERGEPAATAARLRELGRSIHLFLVDVGSCNACNLEVLALGNPYYDASRLGIFFTNSPRHADVLVVVGVPTEAMVEPLRRAYEALPAPKAVLAVGACALSGGAFRGNAGLRGGVDELLPVDLYLPGCPPAPVQILDALLALVGRRREGR